MPYVHLVTYRTDKTAKTDPERYWESYQRWVIDTRRIEILGSVPFKTAYSGNEQPEEGVVLTRVSAQSLPEERRPREHELYILPQGEYIHCEGVGCWACIQEAQDEASAKGDAFSQVVRGVLRDD